MLYVFQVDTGTMLTFDMNLALETVATLQSTISSTSSSSSPPIPPSSQVLLISGGVPLTSDSRVCSYPAGTDTNPIFLFNKLNIEGGGVALTNSASISVPDHLLTLAGRREEEVASYGMLERCAEQAEGIFKVSKEILKSSEGFIHDQHLQHLGWGAVVANLEDIVSVFEKRVKKFEADFWKEFDVGEAGLELEVVEGLPTTISSLATIPLPESLSSEKGVNLLQWLQSNSTTNSSIISLPAQYTKTTELLDRGVIEALIRDSSSLLQKSTTPSMKEIKGLSNRLYTLDQLLTTSKCTLKEQTSLHTSIQTTTTRASSDASILPDLCDSHTRQLTLMIDNLLKIQDINKRCLKAKEELVMNLNSRLKWVIHIQKQISESNLKLGVYGEGVKRWRNLKQVVRQVSTTSTVFTACLSESQRRTHFQSSYDHELAKFTQKFLPVFTAEKSRRKTFESKYGQHFLYDSLFEHLRAEFPREYQIGFSSPPQIHPPPGNSIFEDDDEKNSIETRHLLELKELQLNHQKEILELGENYEKQIWELKEKFKNELEGFKSRVKFVAKQTGGGGCGGREVREVKEEVENNVESVVPNGVDLLSKKLQLTPTGPCKIGDTVLLFYNENYDAFLVFHGNNNNGSVHFVHTDCVGDMKKENCYLGSVVDKEYCVARRAQNRYKVPQGFHFYRVKVLLAEKFDLQK